MPPPRSSHGITLTPDSCGNLVGLTLPTREIWYLDHEKREPEKIANSPVELRGKLDRKA